MIIDDALLNRIIVNDEFKTYLISNLEFSNTLVETKAGDLFIKYIQNTITKDEEIVLFKKFNFSSKKEFDEMGIKLKNEGLAFAKKFPELKLLQEKEIKELIVTALNKIKIEKNIALKFPKILSVTYYQCFSAYIACFAGCFLVCDTESQTNLNACLWACEGFCAAAFTACYVFVE